MTASTTDMHSTRATRGTHGASPLERHYPRACLFSGNSFISSDVILLSTASSPTVKPSGGKRLGCKAKWRKTPGLQQARHSTEVAFFPGITAVSPLSYTSVILLFFISSFCFPSSSAFLLSSSTSLNSTFLWRLPPPDEITCLHICD